MIKLTAYCEECKVEYHVRVIDYVLRKAECALCGDNKFNWKTKKQYYLETGSK